MRSLDVVLSFAGVLTFEYVKCLSKYIDKKSPGILPGLFGEEGDDLVLLEIFMCQTIRIVVEQPAETETPKIGM